MPKYPLYAFALALLMGLGVCAVLFAQPDANLPECTSAQNFQTLVNNAGAGTTVNLPDCLWRGTLTVSKSLTVDMTGGQVSGADLIQFNAISDGKWRSSSSYPPVPNQSAGLGCESGLSGMCQRSEKVFIGEQELIQVPDGGNPAPGQFALDDNRRVVIAQDPAGQHAEIAVRTNAVRVDVNNVTLTNVNATRTNREVAVLNGNNALIDGGIYSYGEEGLRGKRVDFRVQGGAEFYNNDRVGASVGNSHVEHIGGEVYENGWGDGTSAKPGNAATASWHSGGIKYVSMYTALIEGVNSHHNNGNGLWFDGAADEGNSPQTHDQFDMRILDSRSWANDRNGIKCEITLECRIVWNVVYKNGPGAERGEGGNGIIANGSSFGQIHDNIVAWNTVNEIAVAEVNRSREHPEQAFYDHSRDMDVYRNKIFTTQGHLGVSFGGGDLGAAHDIPPGYAANDQYSEGYANAFYWAKADGTPVAQGAYARFKWIRNYPKLKVFNGTPGGSGRPVGGGDATPGIRYLSEAEKNRVLSAAGVPLTP
jgi:hypothetical protein